MNEKKKIALVIPSLKAGGMERVMSELAIYFSYKKEFQIHIIMYGLNPDIFYIIPDNIIIHKPDFIFNNKNRTWFTIKTMFFLRNRINRIRPHTILSFGEYWNSFVLLALLWIKIPVFVSDRCQPDKSLGSFHNALRKLLYPLAEGVIVQTNVAYQLYQKSIPNIKLYVIGNPIKKITMNRSIIKENIVLSVGRLIKTKHHDELIKLFVNIDLAGWKLVIVGGDALKQNNSLQLKKLIKNLNAENKVILEGSKNYVDDFYNKSKIFAFTSSSEGFPNVIGEAMSAGLPIISFDCVAGPKELIQNERNGYLIKPQNYSDFEIKLKKLMTDHQLRNQMGIESQILVKKFDILSIGEKYTKVLFSSTIQ